MKPILRCYSVEGAEKNHQTPVRIAGSQPRIKFMSDVGGSSLLGYDTVSIGTTRPTEWDHISEVEPSATAP